MDNTTIARKLNDYATYLEGEESNIYRVRAYRRGATTVLAQERSLADVVNEKGRAGLEELPGIGASLAYTIEGLVRTGEFRTQRPDAVHVDPERLLTSLPGVGRQLAHVLHEELGITTLEEMEAPPTMAGSRGLASVPNGCAVSSTRSLADCAAVACRSRFRANPRWRPSSPSTRTTACKRIAMPCPR